jgi:hypothetical protein
MGTNPVSMPTSTGNRRCHLALVAVAWLLSAMSPTVFADNNSDGSVEIRSAYAVLDAGVYYVNARIEYVLSSAATEALRNGISLKIELQIEVNRYRRLIWNDTIASLKQRYRLSYHALTDRYVVANLNSGDTVSFPDLDAAMSYLGRVDRLPLIDASLLEDGARYEAAARVVLDVKDLSGPLKFLSRFWGDWKVASERYKWPLRP